MSEHTRYPGDNLESREDFEASECEATCPLHAALRSKLAATTTRAEQAERNYNRLLDERAGDFEKWFKIVGYCGLTPYQAECPQVIDEELRQLVAWRWMADMGCTVQRNADITSPPWTVLDIDGDIHGQGHTPIEAIKAALAALEPRQQ